MPIPVQARLGVEYSSGPRPAGSGSKAVWLNGRSSKAPTARPKSTCGRAHCQHGSALEWQADAYLVADFDQGGTFAHLLGTWQCLAPEKQRLIRGFVLNMFRGEPASLGNAMDWLQAHTSVPIVAIVPLLHHRLPEEDTLHHRGQPAAENVNLALVA